MTQAPGGTTPLPSPGGPVPPATLDATPGPIEREARAFVRKTARAGLAPETLEAMVSLETRRREYASQNPTQATAKPRKPYARSGLSRAFDLLPGDMPRVADTLPPPEPRAVACTACNDMGVVRMRESAADAAQMVKVPMVETAQLVPQRWYPPDGSEARVVVWCWACPARVQLGRQLRGRMPAVDVAASTFAAYTMDTPARKRASIAVAQWASGKDSRPLLLMTGRPGSGKSHLAKASAVHMATRGYGVLFDTGRNMLDDIKATFGGDGMGTAMVVQRLLGAGVLVIDDIGAGYSSRWAKDELESLIISRYEQRQRTVITTNMDVQELASAVDDAYARLASRLDDRARVLHVPMHDIEDWRATRAAP